MVDKIHNFCAGFVSEFDDIEFYRNCSMNPHWKIPQ